MDGGNAGAKVEGIIGVGWPCVQRAWFLIRQGGTFVDEPPLGPGIRPCWTVVAQ